MIISKHFVLNWITPHYNQRSRKYHTTKHIEDMLKFLGCSINSFLLSLLHPVDISDELFLAVCFHDIVYNPYNNDNEEQSCEVLKLFLEDMESRYNTTDLEVDFDKTKQIIMATKTHTFEPNSDSEKIVLADLKPLRTWDDLIEYEHGIFWEYQRYDIQKYIDGRIAFLNKIKSHQFVNAECVDFLINYVKTRTYNVGIYAGSFNPLHLGHADIIEQAELIFDKVIIAQGINTEKEKPYEIKHKYCQIIEYKGLIWELFEKEKNINKTLIRGLRNSFDVGYEDSLRNTIHDFYKIPIVYFFCQKKYEHLSSSMIRSLYPFGEHIYKKYLGD